MRMDRLLLAATLSSTVTCKEDAADPRETGLETLTLTTLEPTTWLPGTLVVLGGNSFLAAPLGISHLRLTGTYAGAPLDVELPATFVDYDRLDVTLVPEVLAAFPAVEGEFVGQAVVAVDYTPDGTRHFSPPLPVTLQIRPSLTPVLLDLGGGGLIYVNDDIEIEAEGLLLGGAEGVTEAVVTGCFTPTDAMACEDVGEVSIPIVTAGPFDRVHATFPFSPRIAGIEPGTFEGEVRLRNLHPDGNTLESEALPVAYELIPSEITAIAAGGSLGQFVDIDGGGFVGDEGLTLVRAVGTYAADAAPETPAPADIELIADFVSGRKLRYVVNEDDGLGTAIDVRYQSGTFEGTLQPIVSYDDQLVEGPLTPVSFRIEPVRQIVWVRFAPSYVESLRGFGLRALDQRIRDRILEVLRRDYATINVEFRTEEPTDFALYATVDIAGPDPNGLGLLGYDNSPGKDVDNERLFDHLGGVNAQTQEDGFPGYGGVFIDSLFTYSNHPPAGTISEDTPDDLFDQSFDPFRPDTGTPVSSQDFADGDIPILTSASGCPTDDRRLGAACAVWVLGSMIGTTVSHEIGHSFGLSDPYGTRFHNLGDAPDRLMDKGGNRTFAERAELEGEGPSVFCTDEYEYLRVILPTTEPDTMIERPSC